MVEILTFPIPSPCPPFRLSRISQPDTARTFHPLSCNLSLAPLSQDDNQGAYMIRDRAEIPRNAFVQYYSCTCAIRVLCYSDYLLTLPDEVAFTPYQIRDSFTRSSTPGRGGKRGVSPRTHLVLSVLTESVFWLFILVIWAL